jgi:hypothetical protein
MPPKFTRFDILNNGRHFSSAASLREHFPDQEKFLKVASPTIGHLPGNCFTVKIKKGSKK